jgi:hypothetical protein
MPITVTTRQGNGAPLTAAQADADLTVLCDSLNAVAEEQAQLDTQIVSLATTVTTVQEQVATVGLQVSGLQTSVSTIGGLVAIEQSAVVAVQIVAQSASTAAQTAQTAVDTTNAALVTTNANLAALTSEVGNSSTGLGALASSLTTIHSTLATDISTVADSLTTLTSQVNNPTTGLAASVSTLTEEITTNATATTANATAITNLTAQVNNSTTGLPASVASLSSAITANATATTANATAITNLTAQVNDPTSGLAASVATINGTLATDATAITANATAISTLSAQVNNSTTGLPASVASLTQTDIAQAAATTALATRTTDLELTVNDPTTGLAHTVGLVESLQTQIDDLGTASAEWKIQADVNGNISGLDFTASSPVNGGTPQSAFKVLASTFTVIDPTNPTVGVSPFTVTGGNVFVNNIQSSNYVTPTSSTPPVGYKLFSVPYTTTFLDGTTASVDFELGTTANFGGYQVADITNGIKLNITEYNGVITSTGNPTTSATVVWVKSYIGSGATNISVGTTVTIVNDISGSTKAVLGFMPVVCNRTGYYQIFPSLGSSTGNVSLSFTPSQNVGVLNTMTAKGSIFLPAASNYYYLIAGTTYYLCLPLGSMVSSGGGWGIIGYHNGDPEYGPTDVVTTYTPVSPLYTDVVFQFGGL